MVVRAQPNTSNNEGSQMSRPRGTGRIYHQKGELEIVDTVLPRLQDVPRIGPDIR